MCACLFLALVVWYLRREVREVRNDVRQVEQVQEPHEKVELKEAREVFQPPKTVAEKAKAAGSRIRDILLEENVAPDVIADTVGFFVRSIIKEKEVLQSIPTAPSASTPSASAPSASAPSVKVSIPPTHQKTKQKRKIVLDEITGEVDTKKESVADNPRLKAILEAREKLEDTLRARGALDPKDTL